VRNKSLEDKKREVLQRTLDGCQQNRDILGVRYDEAGLPLGFPMDEVIGLFDYFEDKPFYTMDLPVENIPHPEPNRRLVDPELEGTPSHIPVQTRHEMIGSFYTLTEHFNRLIDDGFEIFIYVLTPSPLVYNPYDFTPAHRWGIRYAVIDTSRWYNPTAPRDREAPEMVREPLPQNPLTPETLEINDIVIKKSLGRIRFK
jgi:hypothetical protein